MAFLNRSYAVGTEMEYIRQTIQGAHTGENLQSGLIKVLSERNQESLVGAIKGSDRL